MEIGPISRAVRAEIILNQGSGIRDHALKCRVPMCYYVDPRWPVTRAVVTHAHSDHARWGCQRYLAAQSCEHLLRLRMSPDVEFRFLPYGESLTVGGVQISFHPAGHILETAWQVRPWYQNR